MLARTLGYGLNGVNGFEVKVEVYLSGGMMALEVVGLPGRIRKESRDRVRAAIPEFRIYHACGAPDGEPCSRGHEKGGPGL